MEYELSNKKGFIRTFPNQDYLLAYLEGFYGSESNIYKWYKYYIKGGCQYIDMTNANGFKIERIK